MKEVGVIVNHAGNEHLTNWNLSKVEMETE